MSSMDSYPPMQSIPLLACCDLLGYFVVHLFLVRLAFRWQRAPYWWLWCSISRCSSSRKGWWVPFLPSRRYYNRRSFPLSGPNFFQCAASAIGLMSLFIFIVLWLAGAVWLFIFRSCRFTRYGSAASAAIFSPPTLIRHAHFLGQRWSCYSISQTPTSVSLPPGHLFSFSFRVYCQKCNCCRCLGMK
ncbi:hypothetical protein DL96DRAFT_598480 [Flagelloscypha sp. PMI_526]|nr:hypothetical protein DL96DRAFT_598480 [Flagelloscypha sp. PMI_526]